MPRNIRAPGRLQNPLATNNRQHIWISDAQLAECFHRFSHRIVRSGSHVPGPLEARRRASKRKNTSLAHFDHGVSASDYAFNLSSPPSGAWWYPTPTSTSSTACSPRPGLLPFWPFAPPDSVAPQETQTSEDNERSHQDETRASPEDLGFEFWQSVTPNPSIANILRTVEQLRLNLQKHPRLSRSIYMGLLEQGSSSAIEVNSIVLEFLLEPVLNPSGSNNHEHFIQSLCQREITKAQWRLEFMPALQKMVSLGMLTVELLGDLMSILPQIRAASGTLVPHHGKMPFEEWCQLLVALTDCNVMTIRDLNPVLLERLLDKLADTWTLHDISKVLALARLLHNTSDQSDAEIMASLLVRCSIRLKGDSSIPDHIQDQIGALPDQLQALTTVAVSFELLERASGQALPNMAELEEWHTILTSSRMRYISKTWAFDGAAWQTVAQMHPHLSHRRKFVLLMWTIGSMSPADGIPNKTLMDLHTIFQDVFAPMRIHEEWNIKAPTQFLGVVDSLPLPHKRCIHEILLWFEDRNLVAEQHDTSHEVHSAAIAMNRDLKQFLNDKYYRWARHNQPEALARLAESANPNFAALRYFCRKIVAKNTSAPLLVARMIHHNLPFKLSLHRWPKFVKLRNYFCGEEEGVSEVKSADAVDLIHELAVTIATSPIYTHRSAFRNVYKLFTILHRYRAPIHPAMSRALWHTGVMRYDAAGDFVDPNRLRWCLLQVLLIEGRATAARLAQSAAFRHEQLQNFEMIAQMLQDDLDSGTLDANSRELRVLVGDKDAGTVTDHDDERDDMKFLRGRSGTAHDDRSSRSTSP